MRLGRQWSREVNIGRAERQVSIVAGSVLFVIGFVRSFRGLFLAALGGALLYRGMVGHSFVYSLMGRRGRTERAEEAWPGGPGIRVEESLTVNKPVSEVYRFWRQLEHLPRFMSHLESVTPIDSKHSHWVVKAPGPLPITVEWDGEIVEEREDSLLTWRSLPGSQVDTAGSVRFRAAPGDRGTELRVMLAYSPPLGAFGTLYGRIFNWMTAGQVKQDLLRFKSFIETGEAPTTEGQPSGRMGTAGTTVEREPEAPVETGIVAEFGTQAESRRQDEEQPAGAMPHRGD
ncbi:MAG: SRPBCC family protein [Anaerolineae bacterium]